MYNASALGDAFESFTKSYDSIAAYHKNHRINISVNWYESDDTAVAQAYRDQKNKLLMTEKDLKDKIGFKEIREIHDHQGNTIEHNAVSKALSTGRQCV